MNIRDRKPKQLDMRAYVFLVTKSGTSEEVIRYLKKIAKVKGVTQVDSVYGRFDAVVTVEAPDMESLGDLMYRVIEKAPNVIHTETMLALAHHKA
jgi:DNA-binding Lrp family transcriptional regulator